MRQVRLLPLVLLIAGCELFGSEDSESVHVRTLQNTYTTTETVTYALVNETEDVARFSACGDPIYRLERRTDGEWEDISPVFDCLDASPYVDISPGQTYTNSLSIGNPGTYRLGFTLILEEDVEVLYTDPFVIEAE